LLKKGPSAAVIVSALPTGIATGGFAVETWPFEIRFSAGTHSLFRLRENKTSATIAATIQKPFECNNRNLGELPAPASIAPDGGDPVAA